MWEADATTDYLGGRSAGECHNEKGPIETAADIIGR
jgi:hypothetical protein